MRRLWFFFVAAVAAAAAALVGLSGSSARADYGPLAQYQTMFSFNCNDPSFCGADGLGGFWGWAVFNTDGSANAELTGCGHLQGGPGGTAGAQHFSADVPTGGWFIGPNGDFWIRSEVDTFVGHGPPVTMANPFPPYPSDTGIPAAPGHYNTSELLGFQPPPGVSFSIQVVKIPNR